MNLDDILGPIGEAIGAFFASPLVQLAIQALGVYFVLIWLAAAFWAFRDMQQRSANPILPYLAAVLIIVLTPLFFIAGVIVYRIVRPHEKVGEAYERGLAEEALLAEIESIEHCPTCHRKIHDEWIICPTCRSRLKRVCPNCSRLVGTDWSLCAWCGRDFERREPVMAVGAVPAPRYVPEDRPAAEQATSAVQVPPVVPAPVTPVAEPRARPARAAGGSARPTTSR
jgi:RNA polymerase subunit RPABC4/transcription elongation factor Spt4